MEEPQGKGANVTIAILAAGGAAGLAAAAFPVSVVEWIIGSLGISEMIPSAAPPLGNSFRVLFCGVSALAAMACMVSVLPKEMMDDEFVTEAKASLKRGNAKMGFALSKLAEFARGRGREIADALPAMPNLPNLPQLRREDAHPDAAPRPPLVVSRDLAGQPAGMPLVEQLAQMHHAQQLQDEFQNAVQHTAWIPPVEVVAPEQYQAVPDQAAPLQTAAVPAVEAPVAPPSPVAVESAVAAPSDPSLAWLTPGSLPRAPEPLPWDAIKREMARIHGPVSFEPASMAGLDDEPAEQVEQAELPVPPVSAPAPYIAPETSFVPAAPQSVASAPASVPVVEAAPVDSLSIDDLTRRFEAGLARRNARIAALAPQPSYTPPPAYAPPFDTAAVPASAPLAAPSAANVAGLDTEQEVDHALETALATLRGLTSKAG